MIGIFGGTFDPVHLGHLGAIQQLDQDLRFDKIHWVLSARPPHKHSVSASISDRFEMLQLALEGNPAYIADDCEIDRPDRSYTYHTVQHFKRRYPGQPLCLIIGGDSLAKLSSWYRYRELIDDIHIVVMARPGYKFKVPAVLADRLLKSAGKLNVQAEQGLLLFDQTDYAISSTQLRQMLAEIDSGCTLAEFREVFKDLLPMSVIDYIHGRQSYRIAPTKSRENYDS